MAQVSPYLRRALRGKIGARNFGVSFFGVLEAQENRDSAGAPPPILVALVGAPTPHHSCAVIAGVCSLG
jgi:hypothetical protein